MKIILLLTFFVFVLLVSVCGVALLARAIADAYERWRLSRLIDTDHEMIEGNPR